MHLRGERAFGPPKRTRVGPVAQWHDSPLIEDRNFERLFDQMRAMQDQITMLSASVRSIASSEQSPVGLSTTGNYGLLPAQRPLRRVSTAKESPFQGPTTSAFGFEVAKSSLQQRGIVERIEAGEAGDMTQEPSPLASPSAPNDTIDTRHTLDPLWALPKTEALRLCRVYEEEMGIMYPVLELSELLDQVDRLYSPADRAIDSVIQLDREDVHILRLVFACALTAEGSGRSEQAISLFDSVRDVQDNCVWGPPEIKSIIFLTLVVRLSQNASSLFSKIQMWLINPAVNLLLSNGRRDLGMADYWYC